MTGERDYYCLSPAELNREFGRVYLQFPNDCPRDWESQRKRYDSEHKAVLMKRLRDLLSFSPTTEGFKDTLIETLDIKYNKGVLFYIDKEAFQFDDEKSGGIFSPEQVKGIERRMYLGMVGLPLIMVPAVELRREEDDDLMAKWRQDFIALYGDEP